MWASHGLPWAMPATWDWNASPVTPVPGDGLVDLAAVKAR